MIKEEEIITVGKFQKTHALKGELNMISEIDPAYFMEGNPMIVDHEGIYVPYYIESIRPKGSTSYLVKISGIDTEEAATQFVNKEINMLRKDADEWIELEDNEIFSFIGYRIIDSTSGAELGEIMDVDDSTPNVLFLVKTKNNEDIYIPANEDLILQIDEDEEYIKMKLPEGILDIN